MQQESKLRLDMIISNKTKSKVVLVESKNKNKYRLCKCLNPSLPKFKTLESKCYISR